MNRLAEKTARKKEENLRQRRGIVPVERTNEETASVPDQTQTSQLQHRNHLSRESSSRSLRNKVSLPERLENETLEEYYKRVSNTNKGN